VHDLIIRNALLVDGSGRPGEVTDVAVLGERVSEIGEVRGGARAEIDATGLTLAPGIIDAHTHYDAQLTWDPTASPSPALGVTTVVIGNCGFGIAPATPATRELILANLSEVEAMSLDSLRAGVKWEFETFPEYLDMLRRDGVYPNVASFASHSAIRTVVMGTDASVRQARPDELRTMTRMFREAMQAGAIGLGSSTFENHNGRDGIPMPSRLAARDEFLAFAGVMGELGTGLTVITCGESTDIAFLAELARASGRPAIYAPLLHYGNQPERARGIMLQCRDARRQGLPVYAQASCQPLSMDFRLDSAYPMLTVEPWSELDPGDPASLRASFRDAGFRARFKQSLSRVEGGRIFNGNWAHVEVALAGREANRALEGATLAAIARARGVDPADLFFDLALEEDLETTFTAKLLNIDEDRVDELLQDAGNMVSLSDGGAHLTFFCDAGFGMHFLGHWVRELRRFDLASAVRKLTSDVADIYGLIDRGTLRPGAYADMILFDAATIGITGTRRVADLPNGAARLLRSATGLKTVWVNGTAIFSDGQYSAGRRPGHVLGQFATAKPRVGMPQ
jgi:N-acyl-D-aspartate/D-glutamate deacylase